MGLSKDTRAFVRDHDEVECVVQRIGHGLIETVFVDVRGAWRPEVFPSLQDAEAACATLDVPFHEGWEADPRMVRRMASMDAWTTPGATRRAL